MEWGKLFDTGRRKEKVKGTKGDADPRVPFERDHDRLLFSAAVRRLADKTQVFPLEAHDTVRTRLTHSHEVSNLARGIGVRLCQDGVFEGVADAHRSIPALLAAIGLAHDLGNPPFGHQGEIAIQEWMTRNESEWTKGGDLTDAMVQDFKLFEGNAQTLRLVTKLQVIGDEFGLDLTHGTLAAMIKYPVASNQINADHAAAKKHGYFQSEESVVTQVWEATGLGVGRRHPLTYIMEACDDLAYSVMDIEDAVRKSLVSAPDLFDFLLDVSGGDQVVAAVVGSSTEKRKQYRKLGLSPTELNELTMQRFRVFALDKLVAAVTDAFKNNLQNLVSGTFVLDLVKASEGALLVKSLKKFAFDHAYTHRSTVEVELTGHRVISRLMDMFWEAIREVKNRKASGPLHKYTYECISENYRRANRAQGKGLPDVYRDLQLLTDMISGMTDTYAVNLHRKLSDLHDAA